MANANIHPPSKIFAQRDGSVSHARSMLLERANSSVSTRLPGSNASPKSHTTSGVYPARPEHRLKLPHSEGSDLRDVMERGRDMAGLTYPFRGSGQNDIRTSCRNSISRAGQQAAFTVSGRSVGGSCDAQNVSGWHTKGKKMEKHTVDSQYTCSLPLDGIHSFDGEKPQSGANETAQTTASTTRTATGVLSLRKAVMPSDDGREQWMNEDIVIVVRRQHHTSYNEGERGILRVGEGKERNITHYTGGGCSAMHRVWRVSGVGSKQ
ncbi:hypothetical protein DFP72DRAFT_847275 [Ephemerocybe angulata]|uniref:Uncharacterized protein n=1 Tax=Ephemerocybe angulata TaxID=980116 RepID=A0A8H6M4P0_9AGAR|nr:hypothetical protein DFP72DRAFT_847275 [Tulosesus angulatus]